MIRPTRRRTKNTRENSVKHTALSMRPLADPATYPEDLTLAIQDELAMLADLDAVYEDQCRRLADWAGPDTDRDRLASQLEAAHKRDREPHVLRLGELHQQVMALTLSRSPRTLH
jgi:hypothetical protein